ncbi:hypothetical protein [Psychrobacter sp. DAB_AL62B]|uniref:hypothetical protein n=1 Tax=Psychrobacter sp. DAB_AL62B TaxID=1028420 RepID=UPI0023810E79|nr:hypothetical protein [Psychrobacter sp. DAB_AL62B]MDE4453692.1 hypothetical protein [Psychrobacter sp. DAB_AL62B]
MKPSLFKYSVLTVGIVTAIGLTTANAEDIKYTAKDSVIVNNFATANYLVADNSTPQTAKSNTVTVKVSETGSFSLIATGGQEDSNVNTNLNLPINPQASSTVDFKHTLKNDGNVSDKYTIRVSNSTTVDDFDYDLSGSTITYQVKDAGGANVGSLITVAANTAPEVTLAPGQSAEFVVQGKAGTTDRLIDKNGILTVTATSKFLTDKSKPAVATNTDNAKTTTPLYAIKKSATTNLGNRTFDINNATSFVDYTVTITNQGNADGTAVTIIDTLPAGLVAVTSADTAIYQAPVVKTSGNSALKTASVSTDGKEITITGQDIKINEIITVTFRVKKDASTPASGTVITNYAVVKDSTKDDGTFDLVDSSGDATGGTTEKNYEDTTAAAYKGKDDNTKSPITTSNQSRSIIISDGTNKEVALVSSNNIYVYDITNKGTDVTEGATAGDVTFTVKPTTDNTKIDIVRVFADVNKDGKYDTGDIILTPDTSGNYDLKQAASNGLTKDQFARIIVEVSSNGGNDNSVTNGNDIDKFETMTIEVKANTTIAGTPTPAVANTSSTTTMRGINLFKYQAIAACGTSASTIASNSWVKTDISGTTAVPGACIFYKLEATNTFTSTAISNVAISDTLESTLVYENNFEATPTATNDTVAPLVKGTFATLAGKAVGTITFSAKIKQ